MAINIQRKASHVAVVGKSGTGKTEYGIRYFLGSRHDRVLIFDHRGEYGERLQVPTLYSLADVQKRLEKYRIAVFDPCVEYTGETFEAFIDFCAFAFSLGIRFNSQNAETLVVCDETQMILRPGQCPVEIRALTEAGRKWSIDTLWISQRPNKIPDDIRGQWTEVVCFRLNDPTQHSCLEDFGIDPAPIDALPDLHYRWFNLATDEGREGTIAF